MVSRDSAGSAVRYYDEAASKLAGRYDSVAFEDVHPHLRAHLPPQPALILDVGAGSGRDAAGLASLGYRVTAVEPAPALRELGRRAAPNATWLDDRLPDLSLVRQGRERFDFILCSAVLMSLPSDGLRPSLASMAELLAQGGKIAVSLRNPSPEEAVLSRHDDVAIIGAAHEAGLRLLERREAADVLGRGFRWRSYVFGAEGAPLVQSGASSADAERKRS